MEVESLAGLTRIFEEWRSKKRHVREAIPADLLARARRAARHHGPTAVARATKLDQGRLKIGGDGLCRGGTAAASVPTFSRVELAAPPVMAKPFAEIETAVGLKVRLYTPSGEAFKLLSSLCGLGGER
jgi:hypothetical protein